MKNKAKLFVVYFPVIIVTIQVLMNLLYLIYEPWYMSIGFYLGIFFGTNILFAIFLVAYTFLFKFCEVSRWAAVAELLFGLNYLIVQQDNLYNIMFQVIVGTLAIIFTFRQYIKRFPLCNLSLWVKFLKSFGRHLFKKNSCEKAYENYKDEVRSVKLGSTILKQ